MYNMQAILQLLGKKYPETHAGIPVLIIYDDGSGRIVQNVLTEEVYASRNCLFSFGNLDELVDHLTEEMSQKTFEILC